MANENKEIGDIVKKCKILLLDIEGTTTSISFVKDKLFPYAEENVKQFLETQWESDDVKEVVTALRKLALEDEEKSVDGRVAIPGEDATKEDQIEGLVNNVKWQMSSDRKVGPLKQLQGLIWKQGYDKGDVKGHVYDDVSSALELWQSVDGQKVYIYSSGSVQAQKLLFGQSSAGDLMKYIEGYFDTAIGAKQESTSYSAIVEKIGCGADEVLFLTDIVKEGEAARTAGLHVILVSREGNAPLPSEATDSFAVIHSFGQLTVSNKRKTDPQDEQPAKVPKTDISNDVKNTAEAETSKQEITVEKTENEPEKMEVEEEEPTPVKETITEQDKDIEVKKMDEESPTVVSKETTDLQDNGTPVVESEPILTKDEENKADKQETEKMETEIVEKIEEVKKDAVENKVENETAETDKPQSEKSEPEKAVEDETKNDKTKEESDKKTETPEIPNVPKENVNVNEVKETTPIVEETPPTVITEIEEITDKESLTEMAEIIEDIEPVVEEPSGSEDMELQNVGEVLQKECDEILSKVQDVTNLDNIPKPIINQIAEELMETDNVDSNDIVGRILDTEIEIVMRQSKNGPKTVAKTADTSSDKVAQNSGNIPEEKDTVTEQSDRIVEETIKIIEETHKIANELDKIVQDTGKKVEEADKIVEKMDQVVENVEITEKSTEEKTVEPEEKIQDDDAETISTKTNNVSEVKETESKVGKEIPPEETAKESRPLEEKSKPEAVVDKEEIKVEESIETTSEQKTEENTVADTKEDDKVTEEQKKPIESITEESQVNGEKESVNQNGDASKDEELSSRLSVENGKEVNGSNGDSMDAETEADKTVETEVADIKVKTVTTEEPHTELIEQPTEA